ncbi:MAG: hypothetical protein JSR97_06560 [Verrucomicrobia bacterium]|nr:hypothetical protein [Verrucomicrobiota bacterium]
MKSNLLFGGGGVFFNVSADDCKRAREQMFLCSFFITFLERASLAEYHLM